MSYKDIVPYTSVFIDASWIDFVKSAYWCLKSPKSYNELITDIEQIFKNTSNCNSVIPCLSVRSGLDLFLSVHSFPPGSEIIMSAVNIPSMVEVIHSHGLEVVILDVDIKTMKPKVELLESLITSKTKYLLVANIFGRGYDVKPFCDVAKKHNLLLIQDWAEGFSGLDYLGHPDTDLSLFSFGPIKYYTAYGGAIAKVKDINVYHRMKNLYDRYPMQSHSSYLSKVVRLSLGYMLLNCPHLVKPVIYVMRRLGINHKEKVIALLRGFPSEMMKRIRHRPCTALLATLRMRLSGFDRDAFIQSNVKAEYALARLPPGCSGVGIDANPRNHWLFPVLVNNPGDVIEALNSLGVDAYCGATQLNVLKSDRPVRSFTTCEGERSETKLEINETCIGPGRFSCPPDQTSKYCSGHPQTVTKPHTSGENTCLGFGDGGEPIKWSPSELEAKYLMEHVIYLPINKTVPFQEIDKICKLLAKALDMSSSGVEESRKSEIHTQSHHVTIKSKL